MRSFVSAGLVLMICGTLSAGPLRSGWVDADAKWLAHVDCEGFRASTVGAFLIEHAEELGADLGEFDDMRREIGLDPREDVYSVTIYGTSGDPGEHPVIVAVTSEAADEALARLLEAEDMTSRKVQSGGYEIIEVDGDDDAHAIHVRRLERGDRRLVVLGDSADRVAAALKVIDGKAPALSAGSKLLRTPREGSFAYFAAMKLEGMDDIEPASELLRFSDGFAADIAEKDGELSADVTVSTATERDATDLASVVEGMLAMGRLMAGREPDLAPVRELAESIRVRVQERRLSLTIECKSEMLIEMLRHCVAPADDDDADNPGNDGNDTDDRGHDDDDDDDDRDGG